MLGTLLALSVVAPSARAQIGRPGFFVDAVVGAGPKTRHAGSVWYREEPVPYGRVALGLAVPLRDRFGVVLTFDRAANIAPPSYGDVCLLSPGGTCEEYFPSLASFSAGAGLRARLGATTELELVGGASVTDDPTRFVRLDLGWKLASHFALVFGAEHRVARRADGNQLWWRPAFGGIRIQ